MAAVLGLTSKEVSELCAGVAGEKQWFPPRISTRPHRRYLWRSRAVEAVSRIAKEKGARRVVELEVSAPFHCSLMEPAAVRLREVIAKVDLHPMKYPVVTNIEATANSDPAGRGHSGGAGGKPGEMGGVP